MFMETIYTPGIAHLSYIIGDGGQAAVIDPRRDVELYLEIARKEEVVITHIFETHRNEDYVIGSQELAEKTGAEIYHGKELDFQYGNPVSEGEEFTLGNVKLQVLHTPGHTLESISLVYRDMEFSQQPLGVFTGDALFIGDVGRTDFYPDRKEEVAGMLYDSIFEKLLPLGDQVLLWPSHGAGSVCGSGMADRNFSTLGYERENNPVLQKRDRDEFISYKTSEIHFNPPYFKRMEEYNLQGAPPMKDLPWPKAFSAERFHEAREKGMQIVDVRSPEAFAGTHIAESLSLPLAMLPAFGGMFLEYDRPIGLVVEDSDQVARAQKYLSRIGYDRVEAFLADGLHGWETSGLPLEKVGVVDIRELGRRIKEKEEFTLLDVRSEEEFESGHLPGAVNIYLGELPSKMGEISQEKKVTTFCGSGQRAMVAASYLLQQGFSDVEDCLGSLSACESIECDLIMT